MLKGIKRGGFSSLDARQLTGESRRNTSKARQDAEAHMHSDDGSNPGFIFIPSVALTVESLLSTGMRIHSLT